MVCLGNICRSPLAKGILHSKIKKNSFIDSAGTASYHIGRSPDPRSILVAKKNLLNENFKILSLQLEKTLNKIKIKTS